MNSLDWEGENASWTEWNRMKGTGMDSGWNRQRKGRLTPLRIDSTNMRMYICYVSMYGCICIISLLRQMQIGAKIRKKKRKRMQSNLTLDGPLNSTIRIFFGGIWYYWTHATTAWESKKNPISLNSRENIWIDFGWNWQRKGLLTPLLIDSTNMQLCICYVSIYRCICIISLLRQLQIGAKIRKRKQKGMQSDWTLDGPLNDTIHQFLCYVWTDVTTAWES